MATSIVKDELEYWYEQVARFVSSGKTQKEYCLANNINYSQLKKWRYKFSADFPVNKDHPRFKKNQEQLLSIKNASPAQSSTNSFIPITVVDDNTSNVLKNSSIVKMYLKPSIYLELTPDTDSLVLNKIFKALEVL